MTEVELYEKIEDYLKGRLGSEGIKAFQAQMAEDPALAQEVAIHQDLFWAIPLDDDDDDDSENDKTSTKDMPTQDIVNLRKLMENAYYTTEEKKDRPTIWTLPRLLGILTLLLLGVAAFGWLRRPPAPPKPAELPIAIDSTQSRNVLDSVQNNNAKIDLPNTPDTLKPKPPTTRPNYATLVSETYNTSPYAPSVLMSDDPDDLVANNLSKASEAYAKKQFTETIRLLQNIPDEGRTDALKLRSHAYFRLKRYDLAALDFGTLTQSPGYQYDADWYLLLSYAARLPKTKVQYGAQLAKVTKPGHPFEKQALAFNKRLGG